MKQGALDVSFPLDTVRHISSYVVFFNKKKQGSALHAFICRLSIPVALLAAKYRPVSSLTCGLL
jgi:hypothetical protein